MVSVPGVVVRWPTRAFLSFDSNGRTRQNTRMLPGQWRQPSWVVSFHKETRNNLPSSKAPKQYMLWTSVLVVSSSPFAHYSEIPSKWNKVGQLQGNKMSAATTIVDPSYLWGPTFGLEFGNDGNLTLWELFSTQVVHLHGKQQKTMVEIHFLASGKKKKRPIPSLLQAERRNSWSNFHQNHRCSNSLLVVVPCASLKTKLE